LLCAPGRAPGDETPVVEQSSELRNRPASCAVTLSLRHSGLKWCSAVLELKTATVVKLSSTIRQQNMTMLGQTHWAIAEGYIPSQSSFSDPALVSHETACILNAGDAPAHVRITVFFADREPVGPYLVTVEPRRTLHLRFNDLDRPAPIPRDTPYSSVFESDAPIVVQHTRLDSRHAEVSLLSTVAYAEASPR
jgi:hypothetical protein